MKMKWPQDQIAILDDAVVQWLSHASAPSVAAIRESYRDFSQKRLVWDLYWAVQFDLQYDDTHPAYSSWTDEQGIARPARVRRIQFCAAFQHSPSGCDGTHLETVLRFLARKHGLID